MQSELHHLLENNRFRAWVYGEAPQDNAYWQNWAGEDPLRQEQLGRARRMLLYRIADPGPGFNIEDLAHAAITHGPDDPIGHMEVREAKGLRPGGFGLLTVQANVDELLYNEKRNEALH